MSNTAYKELLHFLEQNKFIEFGAVIPSNIVQEKLGLVYPEIASKKEFDRLALEELAAIDYVRNVLLGRGMYLSGKDGNYRILLPSENARQVELYISSADKKLNRALKLTRNSPKTDYTKPDQTEARIMMKKHGVRKHV